MSHCGRPLGGRRPGPVSSNGGLTWTESSAPANVAWRSISCSADGTQMAAAGLGVGVYLSSNSGSTWKKSNAPANVAWAAVASSGNGSTLSAVYSGAIYTTYNQPIASMSVSGGYPAISWPATVGGLYGVQSVTNLASTNWVNVTWPTGTNGANYQVIDVSAKGPKFYRLVN